MKTKTMLIAAILMSVFSFQAFAGPGRGCPGGGGCRPCRPCGPCRPCPPPCRPCRPCRPCPPPPCRGYYDCGGSDGVRLAADIVSLVGTSLNVLRGPTVVTQQVAVPAAQPVAYGTSYNNGYVSVTPVYR